MQDFLPGQRWVSHAEIQMGLGTVLGCDHRTVTIVFMASGETRIYAKSGAPLTRVSFAIGDRVTSHDGWQMTVTGLDEQEGLITYRGIDDNGEPRELPEGALDNFIKLNRPTERLFSGQIDKNRWYELRHQSHLHAGRQAHSELLGLSGGRTSLIPHQLYIAREVAFRYAPRVLLADEVGLGKTIEAGMIIHQQLLTERAKRVLIVVPESLIHQWLVEMLRRFNLYFSIFDEARCHALAGVHSEEETQHDAEVPVEREEEFDHNPFNSEQLILCSLEFLAGQPDHFQQALDAEWDLLVVDEAHHLEWSPQQSSIEYRCIEQLAAVTKGVLLLTATPEQLGKASHFARLRLLDPDRFPSLEQFTDEEQHYAPIAEAVEALVERRPLSESTRQLLQQTLSETDNQPLIDKLHLLDDGNGPSNDGEGTARNELIEHLLDRHGTGRVLFRNTRSAIKGFPERRVSGYPLAQPEAYRETVRQQALDQTIETRQLLCPELAFQSSGQSDEWLKVDPRVVWLSDKLKELKPAKVLVIAADAGTAMDLAEVLRKRDGIYPALFHEHLSIVERDRAAAYFSDPEYGSPVLICSEIGSEGRNFQFAHHLILFDLPLNPDLLEQRIGRLDRIGQKNIVDIHVPYMTGTAQETIFRWYHEGLNAFEQSCPAGHNVFTQLMPTLVETLYQSSIYGDNNDNAADLASLIATTAKVHSELNEALHNGRDQLLEYNSCRPHIAQQLKNDAIDNEQCKQLADYLTQIFDCYGIESEHHSDACQIIRPGNHMQSSSFPSLHSEGMTITYDRDIALSNEDVHYITWEHPLTTGALEMVINNEQGNTAIAAIKHPSVKSGTLLLESLFILESSANVALQSNRYLPPTLIRVMVDPQGHDYSGELSSETMQEIRGKVDRETARKIIRAYGKKLREMVPLAEQQAEKLAPVFLEQAQQRSDALLKREINRLKALQQVNPNVRDDEIRYFEDQLEALSQALESAHLRLDAVRVVICT